MMDPYGTMLGGVHSTNAYGGGGRTYQSGFVTHDEPAVINNKTSFMQSLNNQQQFLDSDDNSSPERNDASSQIMMKSVDNGHPLMNQQNLIKFAGSRTPAVMVDMHGKSTMADHHFMDPHLNSNDLFKANDNSNLDFIFQDGQEKGSHLDFQQKSSIPSFGFNQGKQLLGLQDGEGLSRQAAHQ